LTSLKITSGAVSGGVLIVLIVLICLCLLFNRKRNQNQFENRVTDEFDFQTENCDEQQFCDEEESVFDLQNDEEGIDPEEFFRCDRWVSGHIHRADDLGIPFDGEESFSTQICHE
jgi:hypothetical protein